MILSIKFLAILRVGKGPYVWNPTRADHARFAKWYERYVAAVSDIIDEDICINP